MTKRILVIKTSSMGDVIHTLPALTDAAKAVGCRFDWVVEKSFSELPKMHPAVDKVIEVNVRQWRKNIFKSLFSSEFKAFKQAIRAEQYDLIIDAQGLLKSAFLSRFAKGPRFGLDKMSARESIACFFYDHLINVPKGQHAIMRVRELFSKAIGYEINGAIDYGLSDQWSANNSSKDIVFLHGTTWPTKHWPETYWCELAQRLNQAGYRIVLPWGNDVEFKRAKQIASHSTALVLDRLTIAEIATILTDSAGVVAVDSGLLHLAAATGVPAVSLFGPTNPVLTEPRGANQMVLKADFECSPCLRKKCQYQGVSVVKPACFEALSPEVVLTRLLSICRT